MTPRILEYEDNRVKVTAEAYAIPEIKNLIDKYDMQVEPYLAYVHAMAAPDSPYCKVPITERQEAVIYDIKETLGDFDYEDPLVDAAVTKFRSLYTSEIVLLADQLEAELGEWRRLLRDEKPTLGAEGNMKDRMAIVANIDKYAANVASVRKRADDEIATKMKGNAEMGEY